MQIDRTTAHKKKDIINPNSEKGTCLLTGTAISGDTNAIKKEAEMILKYIDLTKKTAHVECKKQK